MNLQGRTTQDLQIWFCVGRRWLLRWAIAFGNADQFQAFTSIPCVGLTRHLLSASKDTLINPKIA